MADHRYGGRRKCEGRHEYVAVYEVCTKHSVAAQAYSVAGLKEQIGRVAPEPDLIITTGIMSQPSPPHYLSCLPNIC